MSDILTPLIILVVLLLSAALLTWVERRVLGLWQDRYGPNRVGPFGLLQVVADMIKLFTKEDWIPPFADKVIFVIAPMIVMTMMLLGFAIIPFSIQILFYPNFEISGITIVSVEMSLTITPNLKYEE